MGKTQNSKTFARTSKTIGRGSVFEELLLEDLCEWMLVSGVLVDDENVTRDGDEEGADEAVQFQVVAIGICDPHGIVWDHSRGHVVSWWLVAKISCP